jgi:hypothetical protein
VTFEESLCHLYGHLNLEDPAVLAIEAKVQTMAVAEYTARLRLMHHTPSGTMHALGSNTIPSVGCLRSAVHPIPPVWVHWVVDNEEPSLEK